MKNTIKKGFAILLSAVIAMTFYFTVSATDDTSLLTFKLSSDGYAVLTDCDEGAHGVIDIPQKVLIDGKLYSVKYIGEKAFDSCYSISELHIPEGVTSIKNFAFRDCVSLKDVYIPESLVMCQYDAFNGCGKVTVHCYTSNYQLFSVFGTSSKIVVDIIDYDESAGDESDESEGEVPASTDFITRFIQAIQNLIDNIMEYFGTNDDDFDIDDLPFISDIPFVGDFITEIDV